MRKPVDTLVARIAYLRACGVKLRQIAEELQISQSRVSQIQLGLGLSRRLKLTQRARKKREKIVRAMTLAKEPQDTIAKRIGATRVGVWRIQKRLKLKQHVPDRVDPPKKIEHMIVVLLRANVPHSHIEAGLRIGLGKLKTIARRNQIPWKRKN